METRAEKGATVGCLNAKCPGHRRCKRFMDSPSGYIRYGDFSPADGEEICESFLPVEPWYKHGRAGAQTDHED